MAIEGQQPLKLSGVTASADLSGKQYYFVKISGVKTVDVCSALTDTPIGVLQNKPVSGAEAEVVVVGQTKVNSDSAITAGNLIGTSADGQAAPYTSAAAQTKYIVGQALETSGAAGGLISAVVDCANQPHGGA